MRMAEVRREFSEIADSLRSKKITPRTAANRIDILVLNELWRRAAGRKSTGRKSARMTPELKRKIKKWAIVHKSQDQQEIGNRFNVNPGRVSEIVSGLRR